MAETDTFLRPDEIFQITDKVRWSAQCRALARMGVPFKPNAVGRPLVERAAYFGTGSKPSTRRATSPNWGKHGKAA